MIFIVLNTEEEVIFAEKIYNKYCKFMYKVTYGKLKTQADAEDAVQQAFVKIIENIGKVGDLGEKRTRNFIGIICRNAAYDVYNKNKLFSEAEFEEDKLEAAENYDLQHIIICKEQVETLMDFICGMDEKYQSVLLLKAQSEYSINEISEILGISSKTAQKRLERARAKIKMFLERERIKYERQ